MPVRVGDGYAKAARVLYDPVDNGLAAHGQQALGQVVGIGAHALALAGDWQNDFHFLLILWFCSAKWRLVHKDGENVGDAVAGKRPL